VNSRIYLLDGTGESAVLSDAAINGIGRPYTLRSDARGFYVIGTNGVARRNAKGDWSYIAIPMDVPDGPINDVLSDGDYVWVATSAGATRLLWR
jgi:hypothetical protein